MILLKRAFISRSCALCAAVVCLLLLAHSASAQPPPVRFCFNAWKPYAYTEAGSSDGLSIVVLKEAARRAGYAAEFAQLPWKRCLTLVEAGEYDAVIDAAPRKQFLQGPTSYVVYTNTFWVRSDDAVDTFSLAALRERTVGLVSGYVYPEDLAKTAPYRIDYSVDDDMNLRKMLAGRVSAIIADLVSTSWLVRSRGLQLRALQPSHSLDRLYPSFNMQRSEMHEKIDRALREMIDDGYVERTYRKMLDIDFHTLFGTATSKSGE